MRLIDADAFKEYMWKALEETRGCYPDKGEWVEAITKQFCKDIDDQPTVQPEPQWIPCKESMPTKDGAYLVSGRWASGKESVGDCDYRKEDGYFHTAWNFDVLAWRELPEPYQERQEE